jgi:hypothetical protein
MGILGSPEPIKDIDKYCVSVGLILIGLGFLHIFLSGILSSTWGYLLIIIGMISLFYRRKTIIIVVGIALILVGLLNISDSISYEISGFWLFLGVIQIIWGVQELRRYKGTKRNPKYIVKKEKKKGFVWYGLRIGFWIIIALWVWSTITYMGTEEEFSLILVSIWVIFSLFTFILSIIHLTKYKRKSFAIVALVLSSYLLLTFIIGLTLGISQPIYEDTIIFNDTSIVPKGMMDTLSFVLYEGSFLDLDFVSDNLATMYIFSSNEYYRFENNEEPYYIEGGERIKELSFTDSFFSSGEYYVVVYSDEDKDLTYDIELIAK